MRKGPWLFAGALLLLFLALGEYKRREGARDREGFVFDTAQVAQVVWLRVAYQGDTAELTRKGGAWITARRGLSADPERVERGLRGLLGIRAREKVSESSDEERLNEFGIGRAEAKQVEWKLASGEGGRVLLGKTAGTDLNSTYWKWPDRPGVYSTPGDFTFDLASREEEWTVDGPEPAFKVQ